MAPVKDLRDTNACLKSYYEGHSMDAVTFPIRVFKQLGVDTVVCEYLQGLRCMLQ